MLSNKSKEDLTVRPYSRQLSREVLVVCELTAASRCDSTQAPYKEESVDVLAQNMLLMSPLSVTPPFTYIAFLHAWSFFNTLKVHVFGLHTVTARVGIKLLIPLLWNDSAHLCTTVCSYMNQWKNSPAILCISEAFLLGIDGILPLCKIPVLLIMWAYRHLVNRRLEINWTSY